MDRPPPTGNTADPNNIYAYPDFDAYDEAAFAPLLKTNFGAATNSALKLIEELPPLPTSKNSTGSGPSLLQSSSAGRDYRRSSSNIDHPFSSVREESPAKKVSAVAPLATSPEKVIFD